MSLWDDAGWRGCGFVYDQSGMTPPIFGLAFGNLDKGKSITAEWRPKDRADNPKVRIYIVKGIDAANPTHYRVCISPVFSHNTESEQRHVATMCRKHTMTPSTNENLSRFEEQYRRFEGCWLMAFQITDRNEIEMPKSFSDAFKFTGVEFRDAYTIGATDEAQIAIEPNDTPYIPDGIKETAPILVVLENMKKFMVK